MCSTTVADARSSSPSDNFFLGSPESAELSLVTKQPLNIVNTCFEDFHLEVFQFASYPCWDPADDRRLGGAFGEGTGGLEEPSDTGGARRVKWHLAWEVIEG